MKNFLRHTLWQEEFASGRMGRALDILLLFFLFFFFFRYYLLTSLDLEIVIIIIREFIWRLYIRDDITDISPDL